MILTYVMFDRTSGVVKVGKTAALRHRANDLRSAPDLKHGKFELVLHEEIEDQLLSLLKEKGIQPIRGREFFGKEALEVLLQHLSRSGVSRMNKGELDTLNRRILSLSLDPEEHAALFAVAKRDNLSPKDWIRNAIKSAVI